MQYLVTIENASSQLKQITTDFKLALQKNEILLKRENFKSFQTLLEKEQKNILGICLEFPSQAEEWEYLKEFLQKMLIPVPVILCLNSEHHLSAQEISSIHFVSAYYFFNQEPSFLFSLILGVKEKKQLPLYFELLNLSKQTSSFLQDISR